MNKVFVKIMAVLIVGLMVLCVIKVRELRQSIVELNEASEQLLRDTIELEQLMDETYPGWNEEEEE